MGKQYISTVLAAHAHQLDILDVAMTDRYSITVSSDGYAAFWDNKKDEVHNPSEHVFRLLVNEIGIHHVAVYDNVLPNLTTKLILLAFANFDGLIHFWSYTDENLDTLRRVEAKFASNYWSPAFYKDPESRQDYFVATKANGLAVVHALDITESGGIVIDLSKQVGTLSASNNSAAFPNSLAVSKAADALAAVGYTTGDVVVYSLHSQKPVFTFHSSDLQFSGSSGLSSIPRVLEFSPGGTLLAVARDNQLAGSITLYDVHYGENVGLLTTLTHSTKTTVGGFAHEGWIMGLSFNEDGLLLASCGFDKCIRVWGLEAREREATLQISITDLDNTDHDEDSDPSICSGVSFIKRGVRGGAGGDANEGLCVVSFDRGVRWYREAGGI